MTVNGAMRGALPLRAACVASVLAFSGVTSAVAQSPVRQLDESALPQGLIELELPDLLEHYLQTNPPADDALAEAYRITAARLRIGSADRAAQLRAVIDRRDQLIAAHPGHAARGAWLADQASDLCLELWPTGGTDALVLCGFAAPAQRAVAERVAHEVPRLLDAAADAIDARIRELEATPGYRESASLQMQRRRLARDERDRRLPFLRGLALTTRAVLDGDAAVARSAAATLSPLQDVLDGVALDQVRLYSAIARLVAAEYAAARRQAELVIEHDEAPATFQLMAQIVRARTIAATDGAPAGRAALDAIAVEPGQLFEQLLVTDGRALIAQAHDASASQSIVSAYLAMLEAAPASSRAIVRDLVLSRLSAVLDDAVDVADLPPIATIAQAESWLRRGEAGDAEAARSILLEATERRLAAADDTRIRFLLAHAQ